MIKLIGAPCDAGANKTGASLGPNALRQAGVVGGLRGMGCLVEDCGDLSVGLFAKEESLQGHRNFQEVLAWNRAVFSGTRKVLFEGALPVLLGGDHSLAMGSISAVSAHFRQQKKTLRVVWLDAHADFNTGNTSTTGNMHGMPLTVLCGEGPVELTQLGGFSPALLPSQVYLLGVRSVDPEEKHALRRVNLPVLSMQRIRGKGIARAMDKVLADVVPGMHVHVSFDVDCLDPLVLRSCGTKSLG